MDMKSTPPNPELTPIERELTNAVAQLATVVIRGLLKKEAYGGGYVSDLKQVQKVFDKMYMLLEGSK